MKVLLWLLTPCPQLKDLLVIVTRWLDVWTNYHHPSLLNLTFTCLPSYRQKLISWPRALEGLHLTGWSPRMKQISKLNWKLDSVTTSKKILMDSTLLTPGIGMRNIKQWKPSPQSRPNKEYREIEPSTESTLSSLKLPTRELWLLSTIN